MPSYRIMMSLITSQHGVLCHETSRTPSGNLNSNEKSTSQQNCAKFFPDIMIRHKVNCRHY